MATTYVWDVTEMECAVEIDGFSNVVSAVKWVATATSGANTTNIYGCQNITFDKDAPFVPYENLTKAQVLTWAKNDLGADGINMIQQNLANHLANLDNPPVVTPALPWSV